MSDSEEGEIDVEDEDQWDGNQKGKTKKRKVRIKKNKKEGKTPQFISSTYRRQRCDFYNKGVCLKGDLCTYSHDFQPDTAKKICKFYLGGSCAKGYQCKYSHNTRIYPCKFFHIEHRCNSGPNCRFSHGSIQPEFYHQYLKDNKDFILKLYKQNKLPNRKLMEYIENDLPKRDTSPLPIIKIAAPITPILKVQNKVTLKKDPRQRIKPKIDEPEAFAIKQERIFAKQEQQKKIEVKVESLDQKFWNKLEYYFYSYY